MYVVHTMYCLLRILMQPTFEWVFNEPSARAFNDKSYKRFSVDFFCFLIRIERRAHDLFNYANPSSSYETHNTDGKAYYYNQYLIAPIESKR